MANKLTLDFETGMITLDTDHQKRTELWPDLVDLKSEILAAIANVLITDDSTEEEFPDNAEHINQSEVREYLYSAEEPAELDPGPPANATKNR